jgi:hypothetical protein
MSKGLTSGTKMSKSNTMSGSTPAPLDPAELLNLCEKLVASYNAAKVNPDIHADECIVEWKVADEDDKVFLKQVRLDAL